MDRNQIHFSRLLKSSSITEKGDFWQQLPKHVKRGIERSLEQANNGQTKTYTEVKTILANR
jgi:hypothetical protein